MIADSDERQHKLSSQEFFSLNNYINKNELELSLIIGSLDPIKLDPLLFDDADFTRDDQLSFIELLLLKYSLIGI